MRWEYRRNWTAEQRRAHFEEMRRREAMTSPKRDRDVMVNVFETAYDALPFVGDGPYYEFELMPWCGIGAAAALNFFRRIGATVIQHERRSEIHTGGSADDGERFWYDYFLVEWKEGSKQ